MKKIVKVHLSTLRPAILRWHAACVLVLALMVGLAGEARAQQRVVALSGEGEVTRISLAIDSLSLGLSPDSVLSLSMRFSLLGDVLPREECVTLQPLLCTGVDTVLFAPVRVYGHWAHYHAVRGGDESAPISHTAVQHHERDCRHFRPYSQTIGYEPWHEAATLRLIATRTNGCGDELAADTCTLREPELFYREHRQKSLYDVETTHLQGTAYIGFPVNRTVVLTDFGTNRQELDKLCGAIDSLRLRENVELRRVTIKGFASPEGTYAHNEYLARERTRSVAAYVSERCGLSAALIDMGYEPEDWVGLRREVLASSLPDRDELLAIIDSPLEPDAKLARMRQACPESSRYLLEQVFPRLRHTDYLIDYTLRSMTERQGLVLVDTVRRLPIDSISLPVEPINSRFNTFRPIVAVKTNMLYDLLLAPNIEVEVPFGRQLQWSIMGEYWNPWYRWHRKDYSYEIQGGGLELRRWVVPRCPGGRPWLSGHFAGLYVAILKYDLEYRQQGDQGEILSTGISYGYSWPIAPRWNLEASVAAGVAFGQRRHYHAEFESTHLIYKHTRNLFYAGPTKLKFSLVYLLGDRQRKHKRI